MEIAIAVFVGVWIAAAGILSFVRIKKDYANIDQPTDSKEEGVDRP